MLRGRVAEEPAADGNERRSREALGVPVGGVVGGGELAGVDGCAGLALADHGVSHGHPAGVACDALALEAVEDDQGVEVERGRDGWRHADAELGLDEACCECVFVGHGRQAKLGRTGAVVARPWSHASPGQSAAAERGGVGAWVAVGGEHDTAEAAAVEPVPVRRVDVRGEEVEAVPPPATMVSGGGVMWSARVLVLTR